MARVAIYQGNEVPQPETTGARFRPASNNGGIGGAIAEGAQNLAGAMADYAVTQYQIAEKAEQVKRQEELATSSLRLQEQLQATDLYARDWQDGKIEGAPASGAGMSAAILGHYDEGLKGILEGVTDKDVRARLELQASEYRRNYANRAAAAETAKLGGYFAEQNKQTTFLAANRLRESSDPIDLATTIADVEDIVAGYDMPDDDRRKLAQWSRATIKRAFIDGQIERDPENAVKLLDSGVANDLDPGLSDQLRDEAHAAIRARDAAARAAVAQQTAVERDRLAAVEGSLNAGAGTAKDRLDIANRYAELNDASKAAEWQRKAVEFGAVQGSRDLTLPQLDSEITRLTAKQGGEGLTGAEAATLNGLRDQRAQSAARLSQPGGALLQLQYATGKPVTPINLRDPASLARRASEAEAAAAKYGRAAIEPLLPDEQQPLKDLIASGDSAKKLQALRIIAGFKKPDAIIGAARQITGEGDGAFRIAATNMNSPVGPQVALAILRGEDALKANPKVFDNTRANEIYAEVLGLGLRGAPAEYRRDVFEGARAFYATKVTEAGGTEFNEDAWRRALDTSLGAYQDKGFYKGGTAKFGDHTVVIPQGWTSEGLFRRLARAEGTDWNKAAGGRLPVWPDGSDVYTGDLRNLVPEWRGGTIYALRSPRTGRVLQAKGGGDYVIDAARVPWR